MTDTANAAVAGGEPAAVPGYFETRLAPNPSRSKVWAHLCAYLSRWIPADADIPELGAGWCDFANNVHGRRVVALDQDKTVASSAAAHVEPVVGDCTDLSDFSDGTFDVVFASNLVEHLHRPDASRMLGEVRRVLKPTGRLMLMQPNFRLNPGRYFDDFTHVAIFTDQSLPDYLVSEGFTVTDVRAKFLPLTLK